LPFIATDEGHP